MPNKDIFCNSPWYELHIYWDGRLGFCCHVKNDIFDADQAQMYNVQNMSINQWFDSEPMRKTRMSMFNNEKNKICVNCYLEEEFSLTSRRHRSNQKSVIFTRTNFQESYDQSPGNHKFEHSRLNHGMYDGMPIDLHIDLGNYCNLSCKMCVPEASSSIAMQFVKWGDLDARKYVGTDWTRNQETWDRVINELAGIPNLKNVHFMGGETLITTKFEEFVDSMIALGRQDLNFSFVTNGTQFNEKLIAKLTQFNRVGIEVSIESVTEHNSYQRQGTDTELVLENINRYLDKANGKNITVTARPAVSLLTIGSYHTLLRYCLEKNIMVKGLIVSRPAYLDVRILPLYVKQQYLKIYTDFVHEFNIDQEDIESDYNESDPHNIRNVVKNQVTQCINLLSAPTLPTSNQLLKTMVDWCKKWDRVHGYDAVALYPELADIFIKNGYQTA